MRLARADGQPSKGWHLGPWNSDLTVSIGFANEGIDEPHLHERITEIYLVARGSATVRVEQETVVVGPGDVLVIEPGERHTFVSSSTEYLHFVVHAPGLQGDEAWLEKTAVTKAELGL
jgi:mannose-6-phosphate isomerase-like protein (cupin superfamily)